MILMLAMVVALGSGGHFDLPTHPSQLPELSTETKFPRCSAAELESAGFPDHMHSQWWPGWEVLVDDSGRTYGPGSLCQHKTLIPRDDLVIGDDFKSLGNFVVQHNPAYAPCDMLPLLETLSWAGKANKEMLGLTTSDTLMVISPDNIPSYREITGQDVWRLYALKNDVSVIEPYGTLQARTLDGHAGFMLVPDWLLRKNVGDALPAWLHYGLVGYFAENGTHLNNYMVQFRSQGEVVFSPPIINAILSRGPDPDKGKDREMYRRASYSAFLMVWRLVEDHGGLAAIEDFLALVANGASVDKAATKIYGATVNELALSLDPAKLGEPQGEATQSRKAHIQP